MKLSLRPRNLYIPVHGISFSLNPSLSLSFPALSLSISPPFPLLLLAFRRPTKKKTTFHVTLSEQGVNAGHVK